MSETSHFFFGPGEQGGAEDFLKGHHMVFRGKRGGSVVAYRV